MGAANKVRWFHSGMQGAPSIANGFGDMVSMLDGCLINGFNIKAPTSITRAGSTVTINYASGHLYALNSVLRVSGCTQAEYNGDWVIDYVDSNSLRYDIGTAIPSSPAIGAPSTRTAPLDWSILYTALNKRCYQSLNVASNKPIIRVDNSQPVGWTSGKAIYARVHVLSAMTDINTPANQDYMPYRSDITSFPDWGWYLWRQSTRIEGFGATALKDVPNNGGTPTLWSLYGDDRAFYLFVQNQYAIDSAVILYGAGDFQSFKAADGYNSFLWGLDAYDAVSVNQMVPERFQGGQMSEFGNIARPGQQLLKSYVGVGIPVPCAKLTLQGTTAALNSALSSGFVYPNGPDFGLLVFPTFCSESPAGPSHLRGMFPGLYAIYNEAGSKLNDKQVFSNIVGYAGKKMMVQSVANMIALTSVGSDNNPIAKVAFDITGPWQYA